MKPGTCKHFNGVQNDTCKIGVNYKSLKGFPCIKTYGGDEGPRSRPNANHCDCCVKYQEPTADEVAKDKAERDASLARILRTTAAGTPKSGSNEPYNIWLDETAPDKQFTHSEFMIHLKEAHGIDPKATKGKRSMLCHMDGDTWFSYLYEWEIGGKKFTNSIRQNRTGVNAANWA